MTPRAWSPCGSVAAAEEVMPWPSHLPLSKPDLIWLVTWASVAAAVVGVASNSRSLDLRSIWPVQAPVDPAIVRLDKWLVAAEVLFSGAIVTLAPAAMESAKPLMEVAVRLLQAWTLVVAAVS